jgi:DNA-binding MurR/RpiR family transcriptional regulator
MNKRSNGKKNLFARVRALGHLTPIEKKIAVFFEQNPRLLAFDNLTTLSAKAGVSKASMNRFLTHGLGYRDFNQFRAERQQYLEHHLESPIQRYLRSHDIIEEAVGTDHTLSARYFVEYIQHVQAVATYLNQNTLAEAADKISQTDRSLFVMGQRTSFSLAHMLFTQLQYIRPKVFLMRDEHTSLPTEVFNADAGDVAFIISRRRYSENTNRLTRYLHRIGLSIILATDSEISPLAPLADVLLVLPILESASFESLGAWVMLIEALGLMVADLCREREKNYARRADGVLREFYGIAQRRKPEDESE